MILNADVLINRRSIAPARFDSANLSRVLLVVFRNATANESDC
jgi:hypothetical protein